MTKQNCRNHLQATGKPYPKSGCEVCGGVLNECKYAGDIEIFKYKLRNLCARERWMSEAIGAGDELGSGSLLESLDDMFDELVYMYKASAKE